jgi:hypothetical protein
VFESPDGPWEIVSFTRSWETDIFIDFVDRPRFVSFLRQFKSDRTVMSHLRGVLCEFYPVLRLSDDDVIEVVAWRLAAHHLALRMRSREYGPDVLSTGDNTGGGGGGGGRSQDNQQSSRENTSTTRSSLSSGVQSDSPSRPKRSWFSVTVVHEINGEEKPVHNLTLLCQLPDVGKVSGLTSRRAGHVRWDDLDPGGTGDVLATSHDEIVWEVTEDIN